MSTPIPIDAPVPGLAVPRMTREAIDLLARKVVARDVFLAASAEAFEAAFRVPMQMLAGGHEPSFELLQTIAGGWAPFSAQIPPADVGGEVVFREVNLVHIDDLRALDERVSFWLAKVREILLTDGMSLAIDAKADGARLVIRGAYGEEQVVVV